MSSHKPASRLLINLLGSTGILLVLCAVPEGIFLGLQFRLEFHFDTGVAILAGLTMMLVMLALGTSLYKLCMRLTRRRRARLAHSWH